MSNNPDLGEKHFSSEDPLRFAALSGDRNPMHIDPVFARRTQFGQQVVHGVHILLWALDRYLGAGEEPRPSSLRVRFAKPAFVDDTIHVVVTCSSDKERRLEILASGITLATVSLAFGGTPAANGFRVTDPQTPAAQPRELDLSDIGGLEGAISVAAGSVEVARAFPAATRVLGANVVSALLALSRIVGMECPGMHSIFAGLDVDLVADGTPGPVLGWRVARVDRRFRRVDVDVYGAGIAGKLETFLRMPPTRQLGMSEIRAMVGADEFASQVALVVGGSRGLGEVTAKIIAAGGGVPVITYAVGRDEAVALAAEIGAAGRSCHVMRYDVRQPAAPQLAVLPVVPTSFYYFAACSIFRRKSALYEPALMREFTTFFVDGFFDLCHGLRARQSGKLTGFYPSTVAIDAPLRELTEYCLAKLAGEALCGRLRRFLPDLEIVVARLPRIQTDQTATLVPVRSEPPLEVMLPIVRQVQAAAGTTAAQVPVAGIDAR